MDSEFSYGKRKSRPRGHDELAVVQKVRNHCIESLEKYSSSDESFFMISSMHLNRFDGAKFVRELIETMKQRDTKKINYSDGKFENNFQKKKCFLLFEIFLRMSHGSSENIEESERVACL